jgi:hypothetical protein
VLLAAFSLGACSSFTPLSELPADSTSGVLHGAVLLPLTVRSTEGLLGHVWASETRHVEPTRRVLAGKVRSDKTHQHVEVLTSAAFVASLGATSGAVGATVSGEHRTDIAYSVDITGYETLEPGTDGYLAGSACCVNGVVTGACESGYVGRVLRGSGKLRYLRRLRGEAAASLGPVLHASGGARFELVDETTFRDAFFAFVPESLAGVCQSLQPEQELEPFRVAAAENCTVRVYTSDGDSSQQAQSSYFPSADACWMTAERTCAEGRERVVSCVASYRAADGSVIARDFSREGAPVVSTSPATVRAAPESTEAAKAVDAGTEDTGW